MDRQPLTIVAEGTRAPARSAAAGPPSRGILAVWAAALVIPTAVALLVGADSVRRPIEARALASDALRLALAEGSDAPQVRKTLLRLREELARRPLDARTRVTYADLLLALSRTIDETEAAKAHAAAAARQNPVTVPVVRRSALVLARAGASEPALSLIRGMFDFDPDSAAELLAFVEPGFDRESLERGIPDDADAWFAWARQLRMQDRLDETYDVAMRAHARWPDHTPLIQWVAARALRDGDFAALAALLPADDDFPGGDDGALLRLYRARLRAAEGDLEGARSDLAVGTALAPDSSPVQILAGETWEALGDPVLARRHWNRALFEMPAGERRARRLVLTRLARLEDRHGRPADALRLWESVLAEEPGNVEARRRVDALTEHER